MSLDEQVLYGLILGCEVSFWAVLFLGLALRYLLRWRRASRLALLCVPLIDVVLLVFTIVDLRRGANATFAHGLAAAYVGFTIAFGPLAVRWADQQFAHRFGGIPLPRTAPSGRWESVLRELKLWARCLVAVLITYGLLTALIAIVEEPSRTRALEIWYHIPLGTAFFWFVFGPLWELIFFKPPEKAR
jgi:hypothetical protein